MSSETITMSVCIPAYNEEVCIAGLVEEVLEQEQRRHRLHEVIVISDGSTDGTVREVERVADARVVVVDDGLRRGKATRLNELLAMATGDVVVLLDADIELRHKGFL